MTSLVGILNVTPDSFSDGGNFLDPEVARHHASVMAKAGASVIDIGAESTRPGAKPLSAEEEWRRLAPVLEALQDTDKINTWLSVDTRHHQTARRAIDMGVDWINDVSGLNDPKMAKLLAESAVSVVVMHNLGVPTNPSNVIPEAENSTEIVYRWMQDILEKMKNHGIERDRVILDPGIGFGKTAPQSLQLIKNIERFKTLGCKILVGHSRKSFLTLFTQESAANRDAATHIFSAYLAGKGIDYLRVHDIAGNKRAIENPIRTLPKDYDPR